MTQQPFSRPGAIDLSALKRTAPAAPGGAAGGAPAGTPGAGGAGTGSAYAVAVDETNFQTVLEASMTAPVVLVFHSPSQSPESEQLARDVATVADEYDGRFLAASIDVDAAPQIAQAMQIPQVPLMLVILDGRPATQPIPGAAPIDDIRALFNQLAQQLTAQGIAGRHQPNAFGGTSGGEVGEDGEIEIDPRHAPAQDALAAGDIDTAVAEYQRLADANPADHEAVAGLAMAKVLQRTQGVDLNAARAAAAASPDDLDAQTLVADLDMLGGHVEDAFARLVELVRRSAGKDRDRAREHLLGLFGAVGNDDPRVLKGRQALALSLVLMGFGKGAGFLLRGLRLWRERPRLMLLGIIPALIVGVLMVGAFVALVMYADDLIDWATPFADDWADAIRSLFRLLLLLLVLVGAGMLAVVTFTGLTLAVGDPFYEKIWKEVELSLGGQVPDRGVGWLRGIVDGLVLVLMGIATAVLVFVIGLLPLAGAVIGFALGLVLSGRLLAGELVSRPLEARGMDRAQRAALMKQHRGAMLGFGVCVQACFLVPFGGIAVMPAAVAGATYLAREALDGAAA